MWALVEGRAKTPFTFRLSRMCVRYVALLDAASGDVTFEAALSEDVLAASAMCCFYTPAPAATCADVTDPPPPRHALM